MSRGSVMELRGAKLLMPLVHIVVVVVFLVLVPSPIAAWLEEPKPPLPTEETYMSCVVSVLQPQRVAAWCSRHDSLYCTKLC